MVKVCAFSNEYITKFREMLCALSEVIPLNQELINMIFSDEIICSEDESTWTNINIFDENSIQKNLSTEEVVDDNESFIKELPKSISINIYIFFCHIKKKPTIKLCFFKRYYINKRDEFDLNPYLIELILCPEELDFYIILSGLSIYQSGSYIPNTKSNEINLDLFADFRTHLAERLFDKNIVTYVQSFFSWFFDQISCKNAIIEIRKKIFDYIEPFVIEEQKNSH